MVGAFRPISRREPAAAFGAPTFQNQTAPGARHPRTEPMGAGAFDLAWLVGALHGVGKIPENNEMEASSEAGRLRSGLRGVNSAASVERWTTPL